MVKGYVRECVSEDGNGKGNEKMLTRTGMRKRMETRENGNNNKNKTEAGNQKMLTRTGTRLRIGDGKKKESDVICHLIPLSSFHPSNSLTSSVIPDHQPTHH